LHFAQKEKNMGFSGKATSGTGDRLLIPTGTHPARMIAALNLGWHERTFKDKKWWEETLLFVWQLLDVTPSCTISKDYPRDYRPPAELRKLMEKLRGTAYRDGDDINPEKLLGQPCLVTVVQGTSTAGNPYSKIDTIAPVPAGMVVPPATLTPLVWEFADGKPWPAVAWLPTHLYGKPISDILSRARKDKPTTSVSANGVSPTPAAIPTNSAAQTNTPTAPAPSTSDDYPF
jgi:hypothetical protein